MKKLLILLSVCLALFTSCVSSQQDITEASNYLLNTIELAEDKKQEFEELLQYGIDNNLINFVYDDLEGIVLVNSTPTSRKAFGSNIVFSFGFGLVHKTILPYLDITYTGDDWLFMDSIKMYTDNNIYSYDLSSITRDVYSNATCYEHTILPLLGDDLSNFEELCTSTNKHIIRVHGDKYYKDRDIFDNDMESIMLVIDLYKMTIK